MVKISIIVPVYKSEYYLRDCIDSILSQTFTCFELILIDDGSPDNCGKICDEYVKKDNRIKVIHKQNGGLSSARNAGLDIAQGKYIMFCDSDDIVSTNWCRNLIEKAEKNQKYIPICSSCNDLNLLGLADHNEISSTKTFDRSDILNLKKIGIGFVWNKIFERNIIEENHLRFRTWKEKSDFNEDIIFFMQYIAFKEGFVYTGHSDYYYRIISDSLSHGNKQPKLERHIEKYKLWKDYNIKYCNSSEYIYDNISNELLYQIMLFFKAEAEKSTLPTKKFINIVTSDLITELLKNIINHKESKKITYLLKRKHFLILWMLLKIKK